MQSDFLFSTDWPGINTRYHLLQSQQIMPSVLEMPAHIYHNTGCDVTVVHGLSNLHKDTGCSIEM